MGTPDERCGLRRTAFGNRGRCRVDDCTGDRNESVTAPRYGLYEAWFARVIVERAINPIFDVAEAPLPARLDAVEVGADDTIRIAASGSRIPRAAP